MNKPKKRCWTCGSLEIIRGGKQLNKQRFHCKKCGIFFTRNDPLQRVGNRFMWFRKWILERQALDLEPGGLSIDTLQRIFTLF